MTLRSSILLLAAVFGIVKSSGDPALRVSISPFPYDKTAEAVSTVAKIIRENANLYTVQLDNGIPWQAALDGKPYDREISEQWKRHKENAGSHKVYLAIAPLAEDRVSWAPNAGGGKSPNWATDEKHLSDSLKKAYINHVLRAIDYFSPTYVNIGVEAGDMAAKKPAKWPLFDELARTTIEQIHAKHSGTQVGISFGLPFLMESGVLKRVENLLAASDYLGISFYPYMSDFYAKLGAKPLPAPPEQWRQPFTWLKQNVKKPVAICETAYSSKPVQLSKYKLNLKGDEDLQQQYVTELAQFARRDGYLFTVFFLSVDYVPLLAQMPEGDGSARLWTHTGFFDEHLKEKPAWQSYQAAWLGKPAAKAKETAPSPSASVPDVFSFKTDKDLFAVPKPDRTALLTDKPGMRWGYTVRPREFSWALKELAPGTLAASSGVKFSVKSDSAQPLMFQIEQQDGSAFYAIIPTTKDWTDKQLLWRDLKRDPKKKKSKLDPAEVIRIMFADSAGVDANASGPRSVEIANFRLDH